MSSHHFVKDQQEPAVFILDTENLSFDQISPLLEWVPTVLVSESAIDQVMSWGIKIDVILATSDFQRSNLDLLEAQYPVKYLTAEASDTLENGLQFLIAAGHKAVHLAGISHQKTLEIQDKLDQIDFTILDGDWKYYPVKSGQFKKWLPQSTIHIHGSEGMPVQIKNDNGEFILPITYATMLDVPEGISVISSKGIFWIGEQVGLPT